MSWSDDMRCLYCDGKLPLYRKITHGQFCSTAHRKAYWQEQEQLAIERLHQTHNSLRTYRSPVPPETILGPTQSTLAELCGFVSEILVPRRSATASLIVSYPEAFEIVPPAAAPAVVIPRIDIPRIDIPRIDITGIGVAAIDAKLSDSRDIEDAGLLPLTGILQDSFTGDFAFGPHGAELDRDEVAISPCWPSVSCSRDLAMRSAEPVKAAWTQPAMASSMASFGGTPRTGSLSPLPPRMQRPVLDWPLAAVSPPPAQERDGEDDVPFSSRLFPLAPICAHQAQISPFVHASEPLTAVPAVLVSQNGSAVRQDLATALPSAVMLPLEIPRIPLPRRTLVVERGIENLGSTKPSTGTMASPPLNPQLKLAEGRRYAIELRGSRMLPSTPEPADCIVLPADIALPKRDVPKRDGPETQPNAASPKIAAAPGHEGFVPESAGLVPLGFRNELAAARPALTALSRLAGIPQPLRSDPVRPWSKLQPLDGVPPYFEPVPFEPLPSLAPEQLAPPPARMGFSGMTPPEESPAAKTPFWALATGFLKHAPRDLKLLMFAIPALLALAFHPSLPKVSVAAPPATGDLSRNITTAVSGQFASLRQAVYERAAVSLFEDFRSGLDDWGSQGDAATQWSFDASGFVRPGPLALYRPSMGLSDYQVQFLGMIDQKAMSWVVRAADFKNYYVVKLVVVKPGPLTTLGVTRYAVIDGKPQDRADTFVPIDARPDMLYRVLLDVRDDSFALSLQGQMVDSWSDKRLRHGGIGFFSARGEESHVRWVQVTHQYDTLGRLCAYLAPYEIPTTNGSW